MGDGKKGNSGRNTRVCLRRWWGWLIVYISMVQNALALGTAYNYSILFLSLQEEFKKSAALTGWVGSMANTLLCCGGPLSVPLIRRFGARFTNLLGTIMYCGGYILTAFMPALEYTFLTYGILVGLGYNLVFQSVCYVLLEWFPDKNCSRATVLSTIGVSAGMLLFGPLMNGLIAAFDWRNVLIIIGVGNLVISLVHGASIHLPRRAAVSTEDGKGEENWKETSLAVDGEETVLSPAPDVTIQDDGDRCRGSTKRQGLSGILLLVDSWLWMLCLTFGNIGWSFVIISFASFMEHDLLFKREQISLAIVLFSFGEIVGKIGLSLVGDHLPFLKLYVVAAASVLGGLGSGLMTLLSTPPPMLTLSFFMGLFRAGSYGMPLAAAMEIFGRYGADAVTTIVLMSWGLGMFIGAPLSGGLYDLTGNYTISLLVIAGIFLLSAVACFVIPLKMRLCQKTAAKDFSEDKIPSNKPVQV